MKTIKKDECPYSVSNAIRTLAMAAGEGFEPSQTESESVRKKTQSSCRSMYSSN